MEARECCCCCCPYYGGFFGLSNCYFWIAGRDNFPRAFVCRGDIFGTARAPAMAEGIILVRARASMRIRCRCYQVMWERTTCGWEYLRLLYRLKNKPSW